MKLLVAIVLLSFSQLSLASGKQYWLEPYVGYGLTSEFDDSTNTDKFDFYSLSLTTYGYFAKNIYLGIKANYGLFNIKDSTTYSSFEASQTTAGPILGLLIAQRLRFWLGYNVTDQFSTTSTTTGSTTEAENTYKGTGFSLAANFWLYTWMTLGVEYTLSTYDEDNNGALAEDLTVSHATVFASFPFNL